MIRLMDGFDCFAAGDWAARGYNSVFDAFIAGRYGFGQACRTATSKYKPLTGGNTSGVVFMQIAYMPSAFGGPVCVLQGLDGATVQFQVQYIPGPNVFRFFRGTTALGDSTVVNLTAGAWHLLELSVALATAAGSVTLKCDSSPIYTVNSANTQSTANAYITAGGFGGGPQSDAFDDFIVFDGSGAAPNGFIGDQRISTSYPNADGFHGDFLPSTSASHWSNVDETTPNNTDSVASATVGAIDTYVIDDLPTGSPAPIAVQVNLALSKNDAGARTAAYVIRQGTTDFVGPAVAVPATVTIQSALLGLNPATSAPWVAADFNADEFGIKVTA